MRKQYPLDVAVSASRLPKRQVKSWAGTLEIRDPVAGFTLDDIVRLAIVGHLHKFRIERMAIYLLVRRMPVHLHPDDLAIITPDDHAWWRIRIIDKQGLPAGAFNSSYIVIDIESIRRDVNARLNP